MTKKEAILQEATVLFAEKGYKDTSMAELAGRTGVAQGTIFYHFHHKEELFLSILRDLRNRIVREFEAHFDENRSKSGMEMVESALAFYLNMVGSMEDQFLLLHRHDAYELARNNPVCRKHLEAIYECLVNIFEKAIFLGQKDGSIRDIPVKKSALIVFSMVDGLARFNTYGLYDAGGLYDDLLSSCREILSNKTHSKG
jgi:AcrR family transcriptional regulator